MNRVARVGSVSPMALGQTHTPITKSEIVDEMEDRGYSIKIHEPHPEPHPEPHGVSRGKAIRVAVDQSILNYAAYRIPRTNTHPYRCPRSVGCPLPEGQFNMVANHALALANYYYDGGRLPSWASAMHGIALGQASNGVPPGTGTSWWDLNKGWLLAWLGDGLSQYGNFLTQQQFANMLQQAIPKGAMTPADFAAMLSALQAQGLVLKGQEGAVYGGVQDVIKGSPDWLIPVMIGGAVLMVVFMMGRK